MPNHSESAERRKGMQPLKECVEEVVKDMQARMEQFRATHPNWQQLLDQPPKCSKCADYGAYKVTDADGNELGWRECDCARSLRYEKRIKKLIPDFFQGVPRPVDLRLIETLPVEADCQERTIKILKENPLGRYCFRGPSGVGKSYLLWSLCKEAICSDRRVIAVNARHLVRSLKNGNAEESEAPLEELEQDIRGNPTHLFIDELDKINLTPSTFDALFELFDYCYLNRSKVALSVTSNLGTEAFCELFGKAIHRRITEITRSIDYR
jgi:DNA replication protein DnaC